MNQVNPGDQYPIFRVLRDTQDSDTHYVRAVVKNAATNVVLKTIDLTDQGNRIFTGTWDVPYQADRLYVVVITTVYDDAAYTTVSANYAYVEAEELLVEQRWSTAFGGGGGGGGVNYEKIAKMIDVAIGSIKPPQVKVNERNIDFGPLVRLLTESFGRLLSGMPKAPPVDLAPIAAGIKEMRAEMQSRPKFEPTDLSGLQAALESAIQGVARPIVDEFYRTHSEGVNISVPDLHEKVSASLTPHIERIGTELANQVKEHLGKNGVKMDLLPPAAKKEDEQANENSIHPRITRLISPRFNMANK